MITPKELVLALHDGAKEAESGGTTAAVLHAMADSLAESATARQRDLISFRDDEYRAICTAGSRDA